MERFNEHLIIRGLLFDIDFENMKLSQNRYPENHFYFGKSRIYNGCIAMDLNPHGVEIYDFCGEKPPKDIVRVPVALFERGYISSFAMAESINQMSRDKNWNFLVPDESIFRRLNNELPELRIGTDNFFYDGEKELIIPADGQTPALHLSDFKRVCENETEHYDAFYHLPSRQIFHMDLFTLTEWPKDVVYLSIPGPITADPIGVARKNKVSDFIYFNYQRKYAQNKAFIKDISADFYNKMLYNRRRLDSALKKQRNRKSGNNLRRSR